MAPSGSKEVSHMNSLQSLNVDKAVVRINFNMPKLSSAQIIVTDGLLILGPNVVSCKLQYIKMR